MLNEGGVSREAIERLELYVELLVRWQSVKNLIGRNSVADMWQRHILDSLQVLKLRPMAKLWLDLGSGGGFPGMVIAVQMTGIVGSEVHLVESDHRKCAFLRHVSRETGAPAIVHCARIDDVLPHLPQPDVITARALAPMPQLLDWSKHFIENGATGIFLKGQDIERELTKWTKSSNFNVDILPSHTDRTGRIVVVTNGLSGMTV